MSFVACLTIKGNEDLLKWEVLSRGLDWKLSYSRPGLVTFKGEDAPIALAFALAVLPVVSKVESVAETGGGAGPEAEAVSDGFHYEAFGQQWLRLPDPATQFPWWNQLRVSPEHAPSRAYGKLAEAMIGREKLLAPSSSLLASQQVLELGSAPGGASLYLLERGVKLTGVDPAQMDVAIKRHPGFRHWQMPVQQLREHLRARADRFEVLISDLNLRADENLSWVQQIAQELGQSLRLVVATIKANHVKDVQAIVKFAQTNPGATFRQLPSHHRETCLLM